MRLDIPSIAVSLFESHLSERRTWLFSKELYGGRLYVGYGRRTIADTTTIYQPDYFRHWRPIHWVVRSSANNETGQRMRHPWKNSTWLTSGDDFDYRVDKPEHVGHSSIQKIHRLFLNAAGNLCNNFAVVVWCRNLFLYDRFVTMQDKYDTRWNF